MVQVIEQTSPGGEIGRAVGEGLSDALRLLTSQKIETMQRQRAEEDAAAQYQNLLARGFTPQEASLWLQFTEGGKTNLSKEIVERMQREGGFARRGLPTEEVDTTDIMESFSPQTTEIEVDEQVERLTPKERTSREETRYKTNLPLYQQAQKKVKSSESEGLSIQRLQQLNETGELPSGLQRWNVNLKSGELRFPFLANADTQAFVKTINDFTTKAKDSFGARVTNFELNRFMKRLPTLLNTKEGRDVILRQMEIVNQINTLYDQAVLDSFDRAGGIRKVDFDKAQRLGEKQIKPLVNNLRKEFVNLESKGSKLQKKKPTLEKVEKGTPITEDIVDQLLDQTKGDINKAKKLARKLGYDF